MRQVEVTFSWTVLLMTSEQLVGDVIINDRLGCSDHEIAELKILRGVKKASSRTQVPNFKKVDFSLFRELGSIIWWKAVLKGKGAHESYQIFKDSLLKTKE